MRDYLVRFVTTTGDLLEETVVHADSDDGVIHEAMSYLFDIPPEMAPSVEYFHGSDGASLYIITDVHFHDEEEVAQDRLRDESSVTVIDVIVHNETEIEQAKQDVYDAGFDFRDADARAVISDFLQERGWRQGVVEVVLNELAYEGRP